MGFTSDQIAEIDYALEVLCGERPVSAERWTLHPPHDGSAKLQLFHPNALSQWLSVRIRHHSPAGIEVDAPQALPPGQRFLLQLPLPSGRVKHLACTVRACHPIDPQTWRLSADFGLSQTTRLAG